MVIDAHTHLIDGNIDGLLADLDRECVNAALVFTLKGFTGDYHSSNMELACAARKYPDRIFPFVTIHPADGKSALHEMKRARHDLGMRGVKLHPWLQGFSPLDPNVFEIMETAIELEMPVVFHDGTPPYSQPLLFGHLARLYPEATIILAHAGLRDMWEDAIRVAELHKNIVLGACGVTQQVLSIMVQRIGPDRIIFGSDYPFGGSEVLTLALRQIEALNIPSDHKNMILGANTARIINIS
jgi:predicted TIM-barrel fold metal-dependent hydrolase